MRQRLVLTAAIVYGGLFVAAHASESVTVNYAALDALPPRESVAGVLAPKLTPPGMIRRHAAVPEPREWSNASIDVGPAVPAIFDAHDDLYNATELASLERTLGPIFGTGALPAVGPKPAIGAGITGATRTVKPEGAPAQGETAFVAPPNPAPRTMLGMTEPPARVSWAGARTLGEVIFTSDGGVDVVDLDRASIFELDALARKLGREGERVLLQAFGGPRGDTSHEAHKTALRRGLAVRRYLIARGVSSERIDILAVGGATAGPLNRVDVMLPQS